ncbi:aminotransferase class III-fold pyridoxal phosphate-dependent enzyme [Bifidobacterium amazonense]|uniref:Aminotransferase class III-fold pyridoxal phosphate-dependent enzyme n=1 Tax=Bifidobacterium amazonense TaxID=2809027 RepID=A0ABS9VSH1_9BIFI|nr:aminotransferase class III-fold pyridoxal phosphate-dependent enzyme [Bifidobacterium amazonense]MCH9275041.1 aminotransferase class III-fold pyridoxal phosphate-dependent enzyme [Bifidobacterium amazonense]
MFIDNNSWYSDPFERREGFWNDVDQHMLRYGAPYFTPAIIDHASGSYVYTEDGRKILDFTSGQMSATLGHAHPAIVKTVQETYPRLDHLFSAMLSRPVVNLTRRLTDVAAAASNRDVDGPVEPLDHAVLLTTGSEVNDAALRLAKAVTGKFEVVSFNRSWHGLTSAAAGATYSSARKVGVPGVPGQIAIPTPYEYRPDFTDADGRLDWRKQLDYGMLLIFDEAQTSMGRTGSWFGFEHDGVTPDILTVSKTLGAGLPLAAMLTTASIERRAHDAGFVFYTSHVSDPVVAAVGYTVMDVLEKDDLFANVDRRGAQLREGLKRIMDGHEIVGDARGRGLLQGIEIVEDKASKTRSEHLADLITEECFKRGLHMNIVCLPGMGGVFRIAPPLTVSPDEIDLGLSILDESIGVVERGR